jgi:predicted alpha/beta-fold hydrolase
MSPVATPPFRAAPWARGPHAQTLLARMLRPAGGIPLTRERVATPDGDFLDLEWGPDPGVAAPVALVLHGLEGSARRRYMLSACRELLTRGMRPVAMSFRGCSGEPNRTPRFYHSGETGDPTLVLELVRERCPGRRIGAVGFSLGANVLLKLLGERPDGGRGLVDAAVAISVPFDLAAGEHLLEASGMGRVYTTYFLRSLRAKVREKAVLLDGRIRIGAALRARTLREFDDAATAPLHGFRDADEYYARCSSAGFIPGVAVPTLILHSRDDPFLPAEAIPLAALAANRNVVAALPERGGHVGFLGGTPWRPTFWAEEGAATFLAATLSGAAPPSDADA